MRPVAQAKAIVVSILIAALPLAAASAQEEVAADLDALSQGSADSASGLALARSQIGSDELLGALATLERVLINDPAAKDALLLHASLLCRVDDRQGSQTEFEHLNKRDFAREVWAEATAPCAKSASTPPRRKERWSRPGY